jgi:3-oxoacyl-(acyl-carrier-protein) synthase
VPDPASAPPGVAVTGLGILTGFGPGLTRFEAGLFGGETAIRPIASFDTSALECRFGAEVPAFDERAMVRKAELHQYDRVSLMAMAAADEALDHAGLDPKDIAAVTGCMMGTGFGPAQAIQTSVLQAAAGGRLRPTTIVKMMLNSPTAALCARYGLKAGSAAHVSACAASGHAIAQGAQAIRNGEMELCLVGGADGFPTTALFAAWQALGVMSTDTDPDRGIMRPFATERSGFVIGEAAAVLVLERTDRAQARGAPVLAEIVGAGSVTDTPSLTKPTLYGMQSAMRAAMAQAGVAPDAVGHINAHGTATELNDLLEAEAITACFGSGIDTMRITASKAAVGHCMGAGSAVEAVATILALGRQQAPPTYGLRGLGRTETFGLDLCPEGPALLDTRHALSNSFAFGGHFVSLAFRRGA